MKASPVIRACPAACSKGSRAHVPLNPCYHLALIVLLSRARQAGLRNVTPQALPENSTTTRSERNGA
jgi:hypothetical protein